MGDGINIFTFYSYKGGVGRSKALANVGAQLARWGYKTLMIDWDLEAPGLEDYFDKYFRRDWDAKSQEGLIDILHPIFKGTQNPEDVSNSWENKLINIPLEKDPSIGNLYLLSAGKRDEHYFNKVRELDFKDFYKNKSGGEVIEKFRDSLKDKFDFILIDSRTGNTDVGNICTAQMPDILVVLFTAMNASVEGVINTALRANRNRASLPVERFKMPILPIPTRMDLTERTKRDSWLSTFATRFKDLIEEWLEVEEHFNPNEVPEATEFEEGFEDREKHIESHKNDFVRSQLKNLFAYINIPHFPKSSYEEGISIADNDYGTPATIGYYYLTIAAVIANKLSEVDMLFKHRDSYINRSFKPAENSIKSTNHIDSLEKEKREVLLKDLQMFLQKHRHKRYGGGPSMSIRAGEYKGLVKTIRDVERMLLLLKRLVDPSLKKAVDSIIGVIRQR